jgi:hypothetical protein
MFERRIVDFVLRRLRRGGVVVRYWDGATRTYGPGQPDFTLTLHAPSAVRGMQRPVRAQAGIDPLEHPVSRVVTQRPQNRQDRHRHCRAPQIAYERKRAATGEAARFTCVCYATRRLRSR